MEFTKYNSIENLDKKHQLFLTYNIPFLSNDVPFVVTEKVHGANLGLWTDGKTILVSKRNGFEPDPKSFFRSDVVLENYRPRVLDLFQSLKDKRDFKYLVLFGEIYGGNYCGTREYPAVQGRVSYTPDIEFYPFDILLDGRCLDFVSFEEEMEKQSFRFARSLFKGSFSECVTWSSQHKHDITTVTKEGLVPVSQREGHIIRPVTPMKSGVENFVRKDKNSAFLEKHDAQKKLCDFKNHLTTTRVESARSKLGNTDLTELVNEVF